MTIKSLIQSYLDGKETAIETIRTLSAMFNPDYAVDILAIINSITRVEQGDLGKDELKEIWGLS